MEIRKVAYAAFLIFDCCCFIDVESKVCFIGLILNLDYFFLYYSYLEVCRYTIN